MDTEQAFERFLRGEINLFALTSALGGVRLSRSMTHRKVDDKTISILAWQTKEQAEIVARKLKEITDERLNWPSTILVCEFNKDEFTKFHKFEQQQGRRLLLEIDSEVPFI